MLVGMEEMHRVLRKRKHATGIKSIVAVVAIASAVLLLSHDLLDDVARVFERLLDIQQMVVDVVSIVAAVLAFPLGALASVGLETRAADPCLAVGNITYTTPSKVLSCFQSFPFNATLRDNIVDVVSKTLNFHTSTNYQIQAPAPFVDISVDLQAELARMKTAQYATDFDFHKDLFYTVKRANDGHLSYFNYCYDSLFVTYLPFPLVVLNDIENLEKQSIYIAPEAYDVASREFAPYIQEWQRVSGLNFTKYSGAHVLAIDGQDPWGAVDTNARIAGAYQGVSQRQNGYFSSYIRASAEWSYRMGDFAARGLPPTKDTVKLLLHVSGEPSDVEITVPFASRLGSGSVPFIDGPDLWIKNCLAKNDTNGSDLFADGASLDGNGEIITASPVSTRRFTEPIAPEDRKRPISMFLDETAAMDITLPTRLTPGEPLSGNGTARFFLQGKVGIFSLGSFSTGIGYSAWFTTIDAGLKKLKEQGATHLLVDTTNNGGGYICVAHYLHRILLGPSAKTEPQAGFDTKARYNKLASEITQWVADGNAPEREVLLYDPLGWKSANHTIFPKDYNWLEPPVNEVVNGKEDAFSQRIGDTCTPYAVEPPQEALFAPENIGIINNGRCASSCAIFTINLKDRHGVRIAVLGGKQGVPQQYTGTVGGQSIDFATVDDEVKSSRKKAHALAPPDFITDSSQGLTWRLAFGIFDPRPEEWANHEADFNIPFTLNTINRPEEIWKDAAKKFWPNL